MWRISHSLYREVNPTKLVKTCIDLKNNGDWSYCEEDEDEDEDMVDEENLGLLQKEYTHQMTKFVGGLSSVSNLKLKQEFHTNIFRHCSSANLPIFSNLSRLETECPMDLLFSLHCFPNLEHLVVCLWPQTLPTLDFSMEQSDWLQPDSIPDCLASKLKTIQLSGIQGTGDSLRVLAYILSHANVLEKLCIDFRRPNFIYEHKEAYVVWKECQFCRSLFKLPRRSSTCEVVVSGCYVTASGNTLQDGYLTCRMYVGK
ncbi:F-box/FBD/LRR-repeat protein At1g16930-like [Chenopodium quinoa]|uniref:F-box/FBD/LRR-repeat protein At1g16930-like n=1 Tax=Chenopodium quinoa TaxID=63459 RepID=UPI000B78391F|nr:F-box/FBD/LRR-repeat protein At1g16930-like [Chenopodium quinoa]